MRQLLLGLALLLTAGDRTSDRDALLAADRLLSQKTATAGMLSGFVPAFTDDGAYLYPGAALLRGSDRIRGFVATTDSIIRQTWSPVFADVSADGRLGYTFGWTQSLGSGEISGLLEEGERRLEASRICEYAPGGAGLDASATRERGLGAQVRGRAESHQLIEADSTFAALSVANGARAAFLAFAADEAIAFGAGPGMTEGREAIGAGFDGFPARAVLEWWPVAAQIAPSGDLGCTVGEARISSLTRYSKYLTIWRRQADGAWKFVADGGNVRPAP